MGVAVVIVGVVVVVVVDVLDCVEELESPQQPLSSAVIKAQNARTGIRKRRPSDLEREFIIFSQGLDFVRKRNGRTEREQRRRYDARSS